MGLSQRQYAAHRGVSHTAVAKALATGRISAEPDGTIDPVKADHQWDAATDPAKQRGPHARQLGAASARATSQAKARIGTKPVTRAAIEAVDRPQIKPCISDLKLAVESNTGIRSANGLPYLVRMAGADGTGDLLVVA